MNAALLKNRMAETPVMEPVDAVKLLYQSEFGCGHLLGPVEECAGRIAQEIEETTQDAKAPAFWAIGGGLCRMNLHAPAVRQIPALRLARMMVCTAGQSAGTAAGFEKSLALLRALCRAGETPFGPEALERYLSEYAAAGYPPVSHSEAYRRAYAPAYRVALRGYADALPLMALVEEKLRQNGRALLVLDGDCGAGKTTLARLLAGLYDADVIPMDDFFLPGSLRTAQRLAQPGGNVHYERFLEEALLPLLHEKPFSYARYDCGTGETCPRQVRGAAVAIIEGSYSHHPAFDDMYRRLKAAKGWIGVEEGEQLRRLEKRNPAMLDRFRREWIPLEKTYFQAYHVPMKADVTLKSLPWEEDRP